MVVFIWRYNRRSLKMEKKVCFDLSWYINRNIGSDKTGPCWKGATFNIIWKKVTPNRNMSDLNSSNPLLAGVRDRGLDHFRWTSLRSPIFPALLLFFDVPGFILQIIFCGEPEIRQLHLLCILEKENILQFYIIMRYSLTMKVPEWLCKLFAESSHDIHVAHIRWFGSLLRLILLCELANEIE